MARYPLFGGADYGKSYSVTAQRRVNLYAEVTKDQDKTKVAFYPTPGLTLFGSLGALIARGAHVATGVNRAFIVAGNVLWEMSSAGGFTNLGTLSTATGRVGIDDNGVQLMIVDGANGYTLTFSTNTFAKVVDADFPGGDTVVFESGYGLVNKPATGQFWKSASYNFSSWVGTDFATAEASPDNLQRVFTDQGQVLLFGDNTTEFWTNSGALDFPYSRIGSAVVEWGLVARWSVAKFNTRIACLMRNKLGQQQCVTLNGYTPQPISTPDVEYQWAQYSLVTDAEAYSYNLAGHPMYQINFPTAGKSWLFDGRSGLWSELQGGYGRHRGSISFQWQGVTYVTDYANGNVYVLTASAYSDNGTTIQREIVSRHVFDEGYRRVTSLWIDLEPGTGQVSGDGVDPQIMLSVSKDGGHTWGSERFADIGRMGEYKKRAIFRRIGRARDFTFRLRVTDPANSVIIGAWLDAA